MIAVAACNVENLLAAAEAEGLDPAALLEGTGLRREALGRRVGWEAYVDVVERFVAACGDVERAARVAGDVHLSTGVLDILFASHFAPEDLLRTAARLGERAWRGVKVAVDPEGADTFLVTVDLPRGARPCEALFRLSTASLTQLTVRAGQPRAEATLARSGPRSAAFRVRVSRNRNAVDPVEERAGQVAAEWGLTYTERLVLVELLRGRANKDIAGELGMAVATVEVHLTRVYRKSGLQGRAALISRVLGAEW